MMMMKDWPSSMQSDICRGADGGVPTMLKGALSSINVD